MHSSKEEDKDRTDLFSRFYSNSQKVSTISFEQAISQFKALVANYNLPTADMDPMVKQLIANAVTSAVAVAVSVIQIKHKEEMLALQEIIEKLLLLRLCP